MGKTLPPGHKDKNHHSLTAVTLHSSYLSMHHISIQFFNHILLWQVFLAVQKKKGGGGTTQNHLRNQRKFLYKSCISLWTVWTKGILRKLCRWSEIWGLCSYQWQVVCFPQDLKEMLLIMKIKSKVSGCWLLPQSPIKRRRFEFLLYSLCATKKIICN